MSLIYQTIWTRYREWTRKYSFTVANPTDGRSESLGKEGMQTTA